MKKIEGYVADLPYPSHINRFINPEHLDAVLAASECLPPREARGPFTLVDLGCGDAANLLLTAACHPEGQFIGVDAMPEHIALASSIAEQAGLKNVTLLNCLFHEALLHANENADYVVCHGVLAWVSADNQRLVMECAAKWLKPGGVFYVSYNAMPGWAPIAKFQRLLRAIAEGEAGNSQEKYSAAFERIEKLQLFSPEEWASFKDFTEMGGVGYHAHEYLNEHWSPLWSGDIIEAAQQHNLHFLTESHPGRHRNDFNMIPDHQKKLNALVDEPTRELARDIVKETWFRKDIYIKNTPFLVGAAAAAEGRMEGWWALAKPWDDQPYSVTTTVGTLDFDNPVAKALVARLSQAPLMLNQLTGWSAKDILNTIDALWIGNLIVPVDPPLANDALQRVMTAFADHNISISGKTSPFGVVPTLTVI